MSPPLATRLIWYLNVPEVLHFFNSWRCPFLRVYVYQVSYVIAEIILTTYHSYKTVLDYGPLLPLCILITPRESVVGAGWALIQAHAFMSNGNSTWHICLDMLWIRMRCNIRSEFVIYTYKSIVFLYSVKQRRIQWANMTLDLQYTKSYISNRNRYNPFR